MRRSIDSLPESTTELISVLGADASRAPQPCNGQGVCPRHSRLRRRGATTDREGHGVDFVTVVDQAMVLLRQRGRLTYRTLQFQFQLDEAHMEALKDELIYGQRVAVEEEGRVLVWTRDEGSGWPLGCFTAP